MKKTLLSIICFLACMVSIKAQTLYGTTFFGGEAGGGTINKFTPATNILKVVKSFESVTSNPLYSNFIRASDGKLYGVSSSGGRNGYGAIFSFDLSSSTYTNLMDFDYPDGPPAGSLMQASNGKLYGMTENVIFSFDPSSSTYTRLKVFDGSDGISPAGNLMQASDGKLYGTTARGGNTTDYPGYGVIFSFDLSTSVYKKLKDFDNINGANPVGNLMQASDGKLYGMTTSGGSSGGGVIFSFFPSSGSYKKLTDFDGANGGYALGSLIQATDGKLYGMTNQGGRSNLGVIFSFDPLALRYSKLKNFTNSTGINPGGSLMQASDGNLYGMTFQGGANNLGVIFSFSPSALTYTKRKDFDYASGSNPTGGLIQLSDGKLYGMTALGGNIAKGTIFSFDPGSAIYTKLWDMGTNKGGSNISASLVQGKDGKLYGMTSQGGMKDEGVIFSFDPSSAVYLKLRDFDYSDGFGYPYGSLMQAKDGKLYGLTYGLFGTGIIFSFDPSSSTYTNLSLFDKESGSPYGSLVQAANGKLYGMTYGGNNGYAGSIFSFDPVTSIYTNLQNLDYNTGGHPYGSLVQASDGKLYGMTYEGGTSNFGVIFSFDPTSFIYTKVKNFDDTNGSYPFGSLIQGSDEKLYGMTSRGGSNGGGVIFSYDVSSSTYTKLKDFDDTNGTHPYGNLMQSGDGKLYGMTHDGGSSGNGVIFSFDPSSLTYTKLADYTGANGANPNFGSAFIEIISDSNNKPPAVSITSPVNNISYTGPALISLIADAKDPDGTIKNVRFYNGNILIATENYFPYTYKWNNVQPGTYAITAKATDDKGLVGTSAIIHVTVLPNYAPIINVTSPGNNIRYAAPAIIPLIADARDPDGVIKRVRFYNDTILLATENYFPYTYTWKNVPVGNYAITAEATDDKGVAVTSAVVHVSVLPNMPPAVSIINPVDGQTIAGPASIILEAAASDADGSITKVELYNGSVLLRTEYYAPYSWKWNDVATGNYTITAIAYDNNGGVITSAPVNISVALNKSPTVSIIDPVNGQAFPGPASIMLEANASDPDGRVTKVQFYNGETLLHNEYYAPFTYNWQYVHAGNYTITARATDDLGNVTLSAPVSITITSPNEPIMGSQSLVNSKNDISNAVSVKLIPNPAKNILNIHTVGFEQDKKLMISVVSVLGVVVKTIYTIPGQVMQMNVAPLKAGTYFLKVVSGDKVLYTQFVKL